MKRVFLVALASAAGLFAQWTAEIETRYQLYPNLTYLTANGYDAKLDVYMRKDAPGPHPTLIYIHGGGWVGGTKENVVLQFTPFLEMGWNVVNVEYRLGKISLAPAAVEDCLCALKWIASHAQQYRIDAAKLVVTGGSAGGHLALTTGMIPESAGLDRECPSAPLPKVAAIINWYGITDVNDLLDGPNRKNYAVQWLSSAPDREAIARRVSPLTYVRPGLPPILTIHGDADPTVPYAHALRLRDALSKADVRNQLLTIPNGKHGNFTAEERVTIFNTIREFLKPVSSNGNFSAELEARYAVAPNITYLTANGFEAKLDVYSRKDAPGPHPTLIYIHGGGWVGGTKEAVYMHFTPYFEMGWNIVNVEYRLGRISRAPAAVEDCLCALKWVAAHAAQYKMDPNRLVISGDSAGGHLALTTGMVPDSAGLDRECPSAQLPKVAAIVNWYGITDVNDLLDGVNRKNYAVEWLASNPNREAVAKRVSPLSYVRSDLPAILTIHGDADPTVPYTHGQRLHEALKKAGVRNQLFTVPNGKHGHFTPEERVAIFKTIREFLSKI